MAERREDAGSRGRTRRPALLALLAGLGLLTFAVVALAANGDLTQKPGTAGCISEDGTGGACANGVALETARSVTVSPDGTSAYAASVISDAVAVFDRDPTTGELTQKPGTAGCISEDGTGGACANGVALNGANSVTVSPDGTSAYVASAVSDAVAIFDRNPTTGELTQKPPKAGCITEIGVPGGACTDGVALEAARSVTVSPDGKSAYVAAGSSNAVAIFDRDPATGELTQKPGTAGCISESGTGGACTNGTELVDASSVAVSADGKNAYAASNTDDAVTVFDRDPASGELTQKPGTAGCISDDGSGGACADGVALNGARSVAVSPDGASAYATSVSSNAVAIFDRNPSTGELTQKPGTAGCISEDGTGGACADGVALDTSASVTVSPDGTSAYTASVGSDAVAVFDRDPTTGELTQRPGTAGCISEDSTGGACADGVALNGAVSVTVSPDGGSAYAASSYAVAVFDREIDNTIEGSARAKTKQRQKGKKIRIKVKVKAGEDLTAKASGKVKVQKKSYKLKPKTTSVSEGKKKTLKLEPKKKKDQKKIAKALKRGKRATAKLKVKLTDKAGNKKTKKLSVELKR